MSYEYEYDGKTSKPDLGTWNEEEQCTSGLHYEIAQSTISVKESHEWCRWDEDLERIIICFSSEVLGDDKTELDAILEGY